MKMTLRGVPTDCLSAYLSAYLTACLSALQLASAPASAADLLEVRSMPMKVPAEAKQLPAMAAAWPDGGIMMPYVVGEPSAVASRINQALFFGQMGMLAPARFGPGFTPPPDQWPDGVATQEFELARHDDRVLSIKFTLEGCGAYCEGYDSYYSFDLRNGYAIDLPDLLTPEGRAAASRRIVEHRKRLYAVQVKSLKKELVQARQGGKADALQDIEERIALNEECLEREQRADRATDLIDYAKFRLDGSGIVLSTERCSNHAQRALDDVADVETVLTPKDLSAALTPYGRTMVLGQGSTLPPASPFGQVLHGTIAGVPVTMLLGRPEKGGSLSGGYVYDKYGRMISLQGKTDGNTVELTEGSTKENEARMTLTLRGTGLSGQWQGKGKTLPVALNW